MIKVGIYGPEQIDSPKRKQLLRLLLRHPDVDLRAVASPAGNAVPLAELHPVYAGETKLTLERELRIDNLDVLFVIDESNLTNEIIAKYENDPEFRLILLGDCPNTLREKSGLVYGFPEYKRKELVRGARGACSPTPEALLIELALFPLAKKGLVEAPVDIELASARQNGADAAAEARAILTELQGTLNVPIKTTDKPQPPFDRIDLHATMDCPIAIDEVHRIYEEAYDDHNFTYVVTGREGIDEDLRGSNKCLIQLYAEDNKLHVRASIDALTRGVTGNAVHIMNLLFGLYERTGLSI